MNNKKYNKIISYCLWGDNEVYNYGMLENVYLAKIYYPDYKIYIYHSNNCIQDIINKLKTMDNVVLFEKNMHLNSALNMFYRFIPAFEANENDLVLIRDCDSFINLKEMLAVKEFEKSNKQFHIMRDHICHKSLIMGGMWGCKGTILNNLKNIFYDYIKRDITSDSELEDKRGIDQKFLNTYVYQLIINNSLIHASYNKYEKDCKNFPSNNIDTCNFIGQIMYTFPLTCLNLGIPNKIYNRKVEYFF